MQIDPQQLLTLLQLGDSMFPSGAFVHSEGLETYVQQGVIRDAQQLEAYLHTRLLAGSARQDMIALHSAMDIYQARDEAVLLYLDQYLSALKLVKETREASVRVGRQMLRTTLALYPDDFMESYQSAIRENRASGHYMLALGLLAGSLGMDKRSVLVGYGYNLVSGQVSAAIKLMRLGQTQAQQVITGLQPAIAEAADIALAATLDDMQSFTPALDIRAMQHEYLFRRLFNS